jgi:hypothetical protein
MLCDGDNNIFAKEHFCLDDARFEDDYEEVKCMVIPCVQGSLAVKYMVLIAAYVSRLIIDTSKITMSMEKLLFATATHMEIVLRESVSFLRSKILISNRSNLKMRQDF